LIPRSSAACVAVSSSAKAFRIFSACSGLTYCYSLTYKV
jgi:hypothetical protein